MSTNPIAVVTGAHRALGLHTAELLSSRGFTVVAQADTRRDAELAGRRLTDAGADPARLEVIPADFADLNCVSALAREIKERYRSIDVLAHTALTAPSNGRVFTRDRLERTLVVNHLAPYLLTRLLGDVLHAASARVITVSSTLHLGASISFSDLNRIHRYSPLPAFGQAALANVLFTAGLADRWGESCTAVTVDPGSTDPAVLALHGPSAEPDEAAPKTVAWLCTTDTPLRAGAFYEGLDPQPAAPSVTPRAVQRLWSRSAQLTGLHA